MIEPLNREIHEKKKMKSPEELCKEVADKYSQRSEQEGRKKDKIIKFVHDWIPVERELPETTGLYTITLHYDKIERSSVTMSTGTYFYLNFFEKYFKKVLTYCFYYGIF